MSVLYIIEPDAVEEYSGVMGAERPDVYGLQPSEPAIVLDLDSGNISEYIRDGTGGHGSDAFGRYGLNGRRLESEG